MYEMWLLIRTLSKMLLTLAKWWRSHIRNCPASSFKCLQRHSHLFWPNFSCLPVFLLWYHRHPFVHVVDEWCPYQLERVGYLSLCSLPFGFYLTVDSYSTISCNGCEYVAKTGVGFWRSSPCSWRNKRLPDQEEFANRSVMVLGRSELSFVRVQCWGYGVGAISFPWYPTGTQRIPKCFGAKTRLNPKI